MAINTYLLDVNVLIALAWPRHVHHARAHDWFGSSGSAWATTPVTESGFLRISTNAKVVGRPVAMAEALSILRAIRSAEGHRFLPDLSSFATSTIGLDRLVTSKQVTDAHLVDVAASSDAILATLDRGIEELIEIQDRRFVFTIP